MYAIVHVIFYFIQLTEYMNVKMAEEQIRQQGMIINTTDKEL